MLVFEISCYPEPCIEPANCRFASEICMYYYESNKSDVRRLVFYRERLTILLLQYKEIWYPEKWNTSEEQAKYRFTTDTLYKLLIV